MFYKNLKEILNIPKSTLYIFLVYSLFLGILSLTIPLSVQTLVNLINGTLSFRPVISLTIILFLLLSSAFIIRILQVYLVEQFEREIFVKLSLKVNTHLDNIDMRNLGTINVLNKINTFLELPMLQKSISIIFVTLLDILLQIIFCVIILAFYHPLFLAFDLILVVLLFLSIFLPFRKAYKNALDESVHKYKIIAWFEEKMKAPSFFKREQNRTSSLNVLDNHLCNYLDSRESHFKSLVRHHIYIGLTYIVINIVLLTLGSYLIIQGQLSIGQLIAAEILINVILFGMLKITYYLDDCYDFIVGAIKLKGLFDIPVISENKTNNFRLSEIHSIQIADDNFTKEIDFIASNINEVSLSKFTCMNISYALMNSTQNSSFSINSIGVSNYSKTEIEDNIYLLRDVEIFNGTVLENISINELTEEELKFIQKILLELRQEKAIKYA